MLGNRLKCPHYGAINSYVWRHVSIEHAAGEVRDELEAIEVACDECEKTIALLDLKITKRT